ncbi:hypothetical protein E4U43_001245 [Claviceps pusilla]|uniref:Uncharacterized protein n=1 Tax=Claviceps pusilla TaxID=123648 RepID=A0A9P7NAJ9_9HYPO|nr:hypothetical protein E4U43_001245 [Claviceps pusilla]
MPGISVAYQEIPAASGSLLTKSKFLTWQQPISSKIRDGLAVFAVLVILRFLLQRTQQVWISMKTRAASNKRQLPAFIGLPPRPSSLSPPPPTSAFAPKVHSGGTPLNTMAENRDTTSTGSSSHRRSHPSRDQIMLSHQPHWQPSAVDVRGQVSKGMPPAAPPLTPSPALSSSAAAPLGPGQPYAIDSFIHQPNPDYMSSTASTTSQPDSTATPTTPRRRSYHRILPVGDAAITPQSFSVGVHAAAARSSPPHDVVGSDHQMRTRLTNVDGEIISSSDEHGTEWTRHTRVYGGSVCLACAASVDGGGRGGFYGATVTPEEMRQDAYMASRSHV